MRNRTQKNINYSSPMPAANEIADKKRYFMIVRGFPASRVCGHVTSLVTIYEFIKRRISPFFLFYFSGKYMIL